MLETLACLSASPDVLEPGQGLNALYYLLPNDTTITISVVNIISINYYMLCDNVIIVYLLFILLLECHAVEGCIKMFYTPKHGVHLKHGNSSGFIVVN